MRERTIHAYRVGSMRYSTAHALQERLLQARIRGEVPDTLLLLEHDPPVITLGRAARTSANVLLSAAELEACGFDLHETGRGGDVTYHGPGQLVGYPIVDLAPDREDVRRYVRDLEETMIRTAAEYGIVADRFAGQSGAWVERDGSSGAKIGAVGVRLSRWVTMHGFALNVTTDLAHFATIVPCGIADKGVTSIARETGRAPTVREVGDRAAAHFAQIFAAELVWHEGAPALRAEAPVSAPSAAE